MIDLLKRLFGVPQPFDPIEARKRIWEGRFDWMEDFVLSGDYPDEAKADMLEEVLALRERHFSCH